jgi:hypothetical protein
MLTNSGGGIMPSSPQFLHIFGGASGHSDARWPVLAQRRHSPVNSRGTAGFGQSDLLWPVSPQLKQAPLPSRGTRAFGHSDFMWLWSEIVSKM